MMLMLINDISNNKFCFFVVGFFCDYNYMYIFFKIINIMNDK